LVHGSSSQLRRFLFLNVFTCTCGTVEFFHFVTYTRVRCASTARLIMLYIRFTSTRNWALVGRGRAAARAHGTSRALISTRTSAKPVLFVTLRRALCMFCVVVLLWVELVKRSSKRRTHQKKTVIHLLSSFAKCKIDPGKAEEKISRKATRRSN
jgi:hypothetical protein